jgi:hypothetical protein
MPHPSVVSLAKEPGGEAAPMTMSDLLKKIVVLQTALAAVTCALALALGAAWWRSGGPTGDERERRLRESAAQVEQLTKTVGDLSKTVAQLQSANDVLIQTAMRSSPRADVDARLRAIQAGVDEQNMMFRRYLAQYRR